MSSKKAKAVNGALLGAAATALTVNGAMATPLVGSAPVSQLKHTFEQKKNVALEQSRRTLAQAKAKVIGAVVHVPPPESSSAAPVASTEVSAQAGRGLVQSDPPRAGSVASPALARRILQAAALRHRLDPKLVLALSYWESGWDQSLVSDSGAIGLMQVEPATAQEAGPSLLGRPVNVNDPYDNADVGAAILREDLDAFSNPSMALAAYYQGPSSLRAYGMLPDTQQYVDGILSLASRMS